MFWTELARMRFISQLSDSVFLFNKKEGKDYGKSNFYCKPKRGNGENTACTANLAVGLAQKKYESS